MPSTNCLHLLTIDLEGANAATRDAFAFSTDERRELLIAAGSSGIPLILVRGSHSFHLLSTSEKHVPAFRPALGRVQARTQALAGARALRVRGSRGCDAARQFLQQATPLSQSLGAAERFLLNAREAASLSTACGAFSNEFDALFRMIQRTAERISDETRLGRPDCATAELELEGVAAERIVEEELLSWQSSEPSTRASVPPLAERDIELFAAEERHSMIRLRGARVLTKLRTV
jgi:hypothetical protein